MDQKFIREKKELAYHAHIFDVYNDYLRLPDGKHVVYDLVDHVDGCCVLPVDEDGNLILVSQYRNAVDDITLEVPAGCMDEGEDPGQCAVRELEEETGYIAQELQFVTKTYLAIGTSNEQTYIYIATDLTTGSGRIYPNPTAFIGRSHDYDTDRRDRRFKNYYCNPGICCRTNEEINTRCSIAKINHHEYIQTDHSR